MKKINYIFNTLLRSDNYYLLRFFLNVIVSLFFALITSTLIKINLNDYPYPSTVYYGILTLFTIGYHIILTLINTN